MTRGNQRDKAREKNLKAQAGTKKKNDKSGSEQMKDKDATRNLMLIKQRKADEKKAAEELAAVEAKRAAQAKSPEVNTAPQTPVDESATTTSPNPEASTAATS